VRSIKCVCGALFRAVGGSMRLEWADRRLLTIGFLSDFQIFKLWIIIKF
jgi:hypothetical protein